MYNPPSPFYELPHQRVVPSQLTLGRMVNKLYCASPITTTKKRKRSQHDVDTCHIAAGEKIHPRKATGRVARRPTATIRKRQPRGTLCMLPNMPLDIIYEVFSHIGPRELLMLSRVNKTFHTFLTRRSAASFWRDARRNIDGLPDRPVWLHEITFAKLAFDTLCTGCFKKRVYYVDWDVLARLCVECRNTMTRQFDIGDVYSLLRTSGVGWNECKELIPHMKFSRKTHSQHVLKSDMAALDKAWTNAVKETCEDKQQFIHARRELMKDRKEFAKSCTDWENTYKEKCRLNVIIGKMRELGYSEEIESVYSHLFNKFLPSPHSSKNRLQFWENAETDILSMLQNTRVEKLYTRRYDLMCSVVDECRHFFCGIFPGYPEFATDKCVQAILTDSTTNNLDSHSFRLTIRPHIQAIRDRWERQVRSQIDGRIEADIPCSYKQKPTSLAIGTLMRCSSCRSIFEYPELLSHQCTSAYEKKAPYLYSLGFLVAFRYTIWDSDFTKIMRHVITSCGADPASARVEDMDALPVRLYCTHCARRMSGVMTVLNWRQAVAHPYTVHGDEQLSFITEGMTWGRVPQEQCSKVRSLEEQVNSEATRRRETSLHWHCRLCSAWKANSRSVTEAHLRSEHADFLLNKTPEQEQACVYYSPEAKSSHSQSGRGVFLISEGLTVEDIIKRFPSNDTQYLLEAIRNHQAEFCSLPAEHLGEHAPESALALYFNDLHENVANGGYYNSSELYGLPSSVL